jgi:hypothetical protein
MICLECRTGCAAEDIYCRRCGADLAIPSKSLVPVQSHLPAMLQNPQLPRVAAGVGAIVVGVGLELLRRTLLARLTRSTPNLLPTLSPLQTRDLLGRPRKKSRKRRKGYEVQETVVYMSRVIRHED